MIVTLLTDYGHEDDFVGVIHGVIAGVAPEARVIDLTHGIPRYGVRRGALVLARALPYLPVGVHLAVVDPRWAPSAARWPCAPPRRAACSWAPTTAC